MTTSDGLSFLDDDTLISPTGVIQTLGQPPTSRLVAVAAFPQAQARHTALPTAAAPLSTSATRSPPRQRTQSPPSQHQEIVSDRFILSSRSSQQPTERSRPSSRRALTKALELAREAVKLDSTNDDPYGAVIAYGKSVALLSKVMERVINGEDSNDSIRRKSGRRRSVVAQEEEVRRLKAIHDTYAERMNILSLIYSIPPPPHSPSTSTAYTSSISTSANSTRPSSPGSPSSQSSDNLPREPSATLYDEVDDRRFSQETAKYRGELFESRVSPEDEPPEYHHPYSAAAAARMSQVVDDHPDTPIPRAAALVPNGKRSTAPPPTRPRPSSPPLGPSALRPRATSDLPPPAPPPQGALPPAPYHSVPIKHMSVIHNQPRGQSIGHSRTGSNGRLEPLQEEGDKQAEQQTFQVQQQRQHHAIEEDSRHQRTPSQAQRDANRSQQLPPIPVSDSPTNPRDVEPIQDHSPKFGPRPRGASTLSTRSEIINPLPLISDSTTMGTISQRRSKASAPATSPAVGPTQIPEAVSPPTLKPKLPSATSTDSPPSTYTRSRASSQPGQRPNITSLLNPSHDALGRTPSMVPHSTSVILPRKTSVSSKSNSSLPHITVVTGYLSPPLDTSANQLVPPPPIPHSNLPTTPVSPLPPTAPSDPLRKPYHMMSLLRHTMMSKTGGYITPRLHVPQEVWSQGGARLLNLPEKVRVVEVLCSSLEEVQNSSASIFGAGNVSASLAPGIGKKEGELWSLKLEEFSHVCDGVVANFGKKLGVGEGFMIKKNSGVTSWGGKLTRQLDKFTNQKNLDSPASYVQGLSRLFTQAQLLDEHSRAISMQPAAPAYASLTPDLRSALESKLRRSSEFFATVVLTFVVRDMAQLLDKYVKKCEKWLAE
ncbi:hypothetical protein BC826DRAFT_902214 [Russula brevipes]|nr:hypothetical protein BC826DRAFT_902214 [Russula brevipes]